MATFDLPEVADLCTPIAAAVPLCVRMPGGGMICAQADVRFGDIPQTTEKFLALVNAALTPLQPIFNIIDLAKVIVDCITAIPDCITSFNPQPLIDCVPGLAAALNKLLAMIPQMSIPLMVSDIINVLIQLLLGIRQDLAALIAQLERIARAATRAAAVGNLQLQAIVDCESGNMDIMLENMNASLEPINRLLGIINAFLQVLGLPCLPTFNSLTAGQEALDAIDEVIALLQALKALFPDLEFPPIPSVGPDGKCT